MESGRAIDTRGHHESVLRLLRWRTLDNSAAYLKPRLADGARVLDVGCGPGTITADLAAQVAPGRVTALDVSRHALAEAEATVAGRGLSNVDFVLGDVQELDFPDGVFDVVHAHQVLQHVADPVRALAQMRRVSRTGGTVAARDADCAAMTWYPLRPELSEWLEAYEKVVRANGGEPDAGRRLLSWALAAGFTDVVCSASTWCYATPEEREWWGGFWADQLVGSEAAEEVVEDGQVTAAQLERFAAGWHAWGAARDGWFGVLHGEILCRA